MSEVPQTPTVNVQREPVRTIATYRTFLTWLGLGTALAACAELAMLRHWHSAAQLVPWAVLTLLVVAAAAWLVRRSRATARLVRVAAAVSVLGSAFGGYQHVTADLALGPAGARYAGTGESMSVPAQLWGAASGAIGASPVLAPGMVALGGVLLWLAALRWRGEGSG